LPSTSRFCPSTVQDMADCTKLLSCVSTYRVHAALSHIQAAFHA
jgi:hypothetical protein